MDNDKTVRDIMVEEKLHLFQMKACIESEIRDEFWILTERGQREAIITRRFNPLVAYTKRCNAVTKTNENPLSVIGFFMYIPGVFPSIRRMILHYLRDYINFRSPENGETAIFESTSPGLSRAELDVKLLLEFGADPTLVNLKGQTFLHVLIDSTLIPSFSPNNID